MDDNKRQEILEIIKRLNLDNEKQKKTNEILLKLKAEELEKQEQLKSRLGSNKPKEIVPNTDLDSFILDAKNGMNSKVEEKEEVKVEPLIEEEVESEENIKSKKLSFGKSKIPKSKKSKLKKKKEPKTKKEKVKTTDNSIRNNKGLLIDIVLVIVVFILILIQIYILMVK